MICCTLKSVRKWTRNSRTHYCNIHPSLLYPLYHHLSCSGGSNCCYFVPPTFFNTLNYSGSSVLFLKSKQTTNLICLSYYSLVLVPVAVYLYLNIKVHSGSPFLHRKLLPRNSNLCNLIFIHELAKIIFLYMRNLQHGRCCCHPSTDHSPFPRVTLVATVLFVTRRLLSKVCKLSILLPSAEIRPYELR